MNLVERDAYVISQLAKFMSQGMSQRQAVQEVLRTSGFTNIMLTGHDPAALEADVSGLQSATADLTVASTRAATATNPLVGRLANHPLPKGADQTTVWRIRALAAGA